MKLSITPSLFSITLSVAVHAAVFSVLPMQSVSSCNVSSSEFIVTLSDSEENTEIENTDSQLNYKEYLFEKSITQVASSVVNGKSEKNIPNDSYSAPSFPEKYGEPDTEDSKDLEYSSSSFDESLEPQLPQPKLDAKIKRSVSISRSFLNSLRKAVLQCRIYPLQSRRRNEQGKVELEVYFDESGSFGSAVILKSSGYDELDRHSLQAASCAKSLVAKTGDFTVRIPLVYQLNERWK